MGDLSGVISRLRVLLEGGVVLFIENDQSEAGQGSEDRAAGTDHHLHITSANSLPLKVSLCRRHLAVEDGDSGKTSFEPSPCLRRQTDFRNQHDGATAKADDMLDRANVNFRFCRCP